MRLSASLLLMLGVASPLLGAEAVPPTPVDPPPVAPPPIVVPAAPETPAAAPAATVEPAPAPIVPAPPEPPAPVPAPGLVDATPPETAPTPTLASEPSPASATADSTAPTYVDPLQQAKNKAKATKTADPNPWGFGGSLSTGFDSNILLESVDNPTATNAKGVANGSEVHASYQILNGDTGRLSASGNVEINQYPVEPTAEMIRYGGSLAASWSLGGFDPGVVVGFNKFYLNRDVAANATTINVYVAKVFERNVSILGAGSQYVEYIGNESSTGTTYDISYRHWVLLAPGDINKRLELSWKMSRLQANDDDAAYGTSVPGLGLNWRFGPSKPELGTVDVSGRATYEFRTYHQPADGSEAERQRLATLGGSGDVWLTEHLTAGLYLGYAQRVSNVTLSDYNRLQAGLRLAANW